MRGTAWLGIGLGALLLGAAVGCGGSSNDLVSGGPAGNGGAPAGGSGGSTSTRCKTSLDCPADQVCDPSSSICVQCVGDNDCHTGDLCGPDQVCHRVCVTDKQCKPLGQLCDKSHGWCTDTGGGSGGADGGTAGGGGTSSSGGSGATGAGGSGGTGAGGADAGCTKKPLDLVVLLDRSASMQDQNKWTNVTQGLGALNAPGVSGAGLGFFPVAPTVPPPSGSCTTDADCGAYGPCTLNMCSGYYSADVSCIASDYASPAVPIGTIPGVIPEIADAVKSTTPDGSATPMAPALQGTYDYAHNFLHTHPGHLAAVLLVTDGDPTSCTGNDINGVAAQAAAAFAATPSMKTWVVGIGTTANLDLVAQSGGTGQAFMVSTANPIQAVADAVDAVVKDVPCQ